MFAATFPRSNVAGMVRIPAVPNLVPALHLNISHALKNLSNFTSQEAEKSVKLTAIFKGVPAKLPKVKLKVSRNRHGCNGNINTARQSTWKTKPLPSINERYMRHTAFNTASSRNAGTKAQS